jgi:NFU1 iron-sulfur cluster scaffold homolog, mitochondrial
VDQAAQPKEILIRVLPTPNPNALKFVVNRPIKSKGSATFARPSEALGVRLAEDLFRIDGVRQLYFFENVITVTHAEDADIDTMRLEIQSVLQTRLPVHDASFLTDAERKKAEKPQLEGDLKEIDEILDETVRTFLQGDGGDIEVVSYKDHVLEVRYQGACGTCPSSMTGTLEAIQGILQQQFDPEIKIVTV